MNLDEAVGYNCRELRTFNFEQRIAHSRKPKLEENCPDGIEVPMR
jgi:hypothetical protein